MLKQYFSFITSTNNDSFSKLKGLDLKELLNQRFFRKFAD